MGLREVRLPEVSGIVRVSNINGHVYHNGVRVNTFTQKSPRHRHGYSCCSIEQNQFYVHKLVAMAWLGNVEELPNVIHLDGNTLNNDAKNLEWSDRQTRNFSWDKKARGRSPLNYEAVQAILRRLEAGETNKAIAADYGVHPMSITRIRNRYTKNE